MEKNIKKISTIFMIILILVTASFKVYAINKSSNNINIKQNNDSIEQISEIPLSEVPQLSDNSKKLLYNLKKEDFEIDKVQKAESVYNSNLDKKTIRVTTNDVEINIDNNGEVISYKNLEDYSTKDKDKKDYTDVEINTLNTDFKITQENELESIIKQIEDDNDLKEYELMDCSNEIEGFWTLTWCRKYENNLINQYDCVNIVVDAKDGSVMLFGKNKVEPNAVNPLISDIEAINLSKETLSKFSIAENDNINCQLGFFRPNYYWNDNKEKTSDVRLSWGIEVNGINVQIDAITGENIGGSFSRSTDCARAMGVVAFEEQDTLTNLAYEAFQRLGYNQKKYPPVTWSINQVDIDWMLSRSDMYGLYLASHGDIVDGRNVITDNENWEIWSDNSFGNWHFVFLDACYTSATQNFANAFKATNAGRCFIGWNIEIANDTVIAFDKSFFPKLGKMSVCDAVVETLWEVRNEGYNYGMYMCDPGFSGDANYYGWAW